MKIILFFLFFCISITTIAQVGLSGNQLSFNTISQLSTTKGLAGGYKVNVLGYYNVGDGGGGTFYWNATSTATAQQGIIIQVTGIATGRWIRELNGTELNVLMFGAKGDGVTDDQPAFAAATLISTNKIIMVPPGTYRFGSQLGINTSNTEFRGYGPKLSKIISDTGVHTSIFIGYNVSNVTIRELFVQNKDTAYGTVIKLQLDTAFDGIQTRIDTNINILNCELTGKNADGVAIIAHRTGFGGTIRKVKIMNNYIHDIGNAGLNILGETNVKWYSDFEMGYNNIVNTGLRTHSLGFGITVSGNGDNFYAHDNTIDNFWIIGIEFSGVSNSTQERNKFKNAYGNTGTTPYTFNCLASPIGFNNKAIGNVVLDSVYQHPYIINQEKFYSSGNICKASTGGLYVDSVRYSIFKDDWYTHTGASGYSMWLRSSVFQNVFDGVHFIGNVGESQLILSTDSVSDNTFSKCFLVGPTSSGNIFNGGGQTPNRNARNYFKDCYLRSSLSAGFVYNMDINVNKPLYDETIDSFGISKWYPRALTVSNNYVTLRPNDSLGVGITTPDARFSLKGRASLQYINQDPTINTITGVNAIIRQQTTAGTTTDFYNFFSSLSINSGDSVRTHYGYFLNNLDPTGKLLNAINFYGNGGSFSNIGNLTMFSAQDATVTGAYKAFTSNATAGTNKWAIALDGTATSYSMGSLYLGSTTGNTSAQFGSFSNTTKGWLPPVLTGTQMNAISTPVSGLMVSCSDSTFDLCIYNGSNWVRQRGSGGVSIPPNIGSGFRIYAPQTPGFKSIVVLPPLLIDSTTNTNALTFKADTTTSITGLTSLFQNSLNEKKANKDQANGYPSLNSFGIVPSNELPGILYQFNVKDYGAVGDGVTNDLAAINTCIAAALASSGQATIVFPQGTYLINGAISSLTRPVLIQGINATIKANGGTTYNVFNLGADSIRLNNVKIVGSSAAQTGINCNSHKFFDVKDCDFTGLARGIRWANTSGSFNAGNISLCNFYTNTVGLFSDTLGEYVSVNGGLFVTNGVGILDDGGNNTYNALNVNNNTTAMRFTGGSNNSHGIISSCNLNHNDTALSVVGATLGETVSACHIYDGVVILVKSSGWTFDNCTLQPKQFNFNVVSNVIVQNSSLSNAFAGLSNINYNGVTGAVRWINNTPSANDVTPLPDSIGGRSVRIPATSGILDLGKGDQQYITLGADSTITAIIHPTLGKRYRIEVIPNGHTFTLIDNSFLSGTYNTAAALNVFEITCIDAGSDPRFIGGISQPGILVSRSTNSINWHNLIGTGTISGSNITKTGPDQLNFTVAAEADKLLMGDGYVQFQAATGNANIIFGLATISVNSPSGNYNLINYGIYLFGTNGVDVAESFTLHTTATTWANGDWFRVKVTGSVVTYEKSTNSGGSWTTFYTSLIAATTFPLYPNVSIRAFTTLTDPRIYGATVLNNLPSFYSVAYTGPITATNNAGGSVLTRQVITTGSSATVTGGNYLVTFDPASTISTYTLTLPASPIDLQVVEIEAGGTITAGAVITTLTISANSGQNIIQSATPIAMAAGDYIKYRWRSSVSKWYREN